MLVDVAQTVTFVAGVAQKIPIVVGQAGKYVLLVNGTQCKVMLSNPAGNDVLEVCGTNARGVHSISTPNLGTFNLTVTSTQTGSTTLTLRAWSGLDYLWANPLWTFYKSNC